MMDALLTDADLRSCESLELRFLSLIGSYISVEVINFKLMRSEMTFAILDCMDVCGVSSSPRNLAQPRIVSTLAHLIVFLSLRLHSESKKR